MKATLAMTLTSLLAVLAALLISSASAQVTQCAPGSSPQLHLVAQLSVSGCALTVYEVHDTGAKYDRHLVVQPLMCVTGDLHSVIPRYDPITQQTYVSVPVMLRDDAMLAEAERQLRHLSPKSVKFATVTDIGVSTDASSRIQALGFYWTQEDAAGVLRLGCSSALSREICAAKLNAFRHPEFLAQPLNRVKLTATVRLSRDIITQFKFTPMMKSLSLLDPETSNQKNVGLPTCEQLRFVRSIRLGNCTARVHQSLYMKGHFLIEPLLCHSNTNMSKESVQYDYSTDTHFLKLDVVLQDDVTVDALKTQLADLEPRSVAFMRLWRAQSVVASALSARFRVGSLMVSADWRSAQVRVHCRTKDACLKLGLSVSDQPVSLWRQIQWTVTSLIDTGCLFLSRVSRFVSTVSSADRSNKSAVELLYFNTERDWKAPCKERCQISSGWSNTCWFSRTPDGRQFVVIQQRLAGRVSFERNWADYERGFGDESDFWIGLSSIHSLSINGATLRVEMKLPNGTKQHVEYAGFKVGDAASNYQMTFKEMLRDRSSFSGMGEDGMQHSKGMQFSTMDRDNDKISESCSNKWGNAGFWFNVCNNVHPNGRFWDGKEGDWRNMHWYISGNYVTLREVRLMLQI